MKHKSAQAQMVAMFFIPLTVFVAIPATQHYKTWVQKREATAKLLEAVNSAKPFSVDALVAQGADVNAREKFGYSVLHVAVTNHPSAVGILLKRGANMNARNDWGQTPLYVAAEAGNVLPVRGLLSHKADIHAHGNWGTSDAADIEQAQQRVEALLRGSAPHQNHPEILRLLKAAEAKE